MGGDQLTVARHLTAKCLYNNRPSQSVNSKVRFFWCYASNLSSSPYLHLMRIEKRGDLSRPPRFYYTVETDAYFCLRLRLASRAEAPAARRIILAGSGAWPTCAM